MSYFQPNFYLYFKSFLINTSQEQFINIILNILFLLFFLHQIIIILMKNLIIPKLIQGNIFIYLNNLVCSYSQYIQNIILALQQMLIFQQLTHLLLLKYYISLQKKAMKLKEIMICLSILQYYKHINPRYLIILLSPLENL